MDKVKIVELTEISLREHSSKQTRICSYFRCDLLNLTIISREKIFSFIAVKNAQILFLDFALEI